MISINRLKAGGIGLLFLFALNVNSEIEKQPNYDIVLFDLIEEGGVYHLKNPEVIANSQNYENQPHFTDDSNRLYFTRIENDNADIWQWSIIDKKATKLVDDELSEYSPTQIPFQVDNISTVRVEKDGVQRLWSYSPKKGFSLLFESIKPVGYHVWSNTNVGLFILGEPHQLQVTQLGKETTKIIDSNIGRCLQKIPGKNQMSYTVIENNLHRLNVYDFSSGVIEKLHFLPEKTQDYAWLSSSKVISSDGYSLFITNTNYKADQNKQANWLKINNSTKFIPTEISRLAISPNKQKIAVVFEAP